MKPSNSTFKKPPPPDRGTVYGVPLGIVLVLLLAGCATMPGDTAPAASGDRDALERHAIGGLPRSQRNIIVLYNEGYVVGFSEELRDPLWSAYYCAAKPSFPFEDDRPTFAADPRVPLAARLNHHDYDRPKDPAGNYVLPLYDRGHMAPNYAIGTRYGEKAQLETFRMTNVVPQRSTMNSQTWRALEAEIARNFAPALQGVWVIVGPVFQSPVQWFNGKAAIPESLFCIIVDRTEEGQLRALALIMNQTVSGKRLIGEFFTTVDEIERVTGLDFLPALPDDIEDRIEAARPDAGWDPRLELNANKKYAD